MLENVASSLTSVHTFLGVLCLPEPTHLYNQLRLEILPVPSMMNEQSLGPFQNVRLLSREINYIALCKLHL
mgnify:CR=1 FL=1